MMMISIILCFLIFASIPIAIDAQTTYNSGLTSDASTATTSDDWTTEINTGAPGSDGSSTSISETTDDYISVGLTSQSSTLIGSGSTSDASNPTTQTVPSDSLDSTIPVMSNNASEPTTVAITQDFSTTSIATIVDDSSEPTTVAITQISLDSTTVTIPEDSSDSTTIAISQTSTTLGITDDTSPASTDSITEDSSSLHSSSTDPVVSDFSSSDIPTTSNSFSSTTEILQTTIVTDGDWTDPSNAGISSSTVTVETDPVNNNSTDSIQTLWPDIENNTTTPYNNFESWFTSTPKPPLSLEAQQMIIKALLDGRKPSAMFPRPPSSTGNTASYTVIVRQNGIVIEGKYTLYGVDPLTYSIVRCIEYNNLNQIIRTTQSYAKPGFCMIQDDGISRITKLEIQIDGIYGSPVGGFIKVDGTYLPPNGYVPNLSQMVGNQNDEMCYRMRISADKMPTGQITFDSTSGASIWCIALPRLDSNMMLRIQRVLVEDSNDNVGRVTVEPYGRSNSNRPARLETMIGAGNTPVLGFRSDYSDDILFFLISIFSSYPGMQLDVNRISIIVDYCSVTKSSAHPPLNMINPGFVFPNHVIYHPNIANPPIITIPRPSYSIPSGNQMYDPEMPFRIFPADNGFSNLNTPSNQLPATSCKQPQYLSVNSTSKNVVVQDNIWYIPVALIYGARVPLDSLVIQNRGQQISGTVFLTLIDNYEQPFYSSSAIITSNSPAFFTDISSIPVFAIQIQFPEDAQSSFYLIHITLCRNMNPRFYNVGNTPNQPNGVLYPSLLQQPNLRNSQTDIDIDGYQDRSPPAYLYPDHRGSSPSFGRLWSGNKPSLPMSPPFLNSRLPGVYDSQTMFERPVDSYKPDFLSPQYQQGQSIPPLMPNPYPSESQRWPPPSVDIQERPSRQGQAGRPLQNIPPFQQGSIPDAEKLWNRPEIVPENQPSLTPQYGNQNQTKQPVPDQNVLQNQRQQFPFLPSFQLPTYWQPPSYPTNQPANGDGMYMAPNNMYPSNYPQLQGTAPQRLPNEQSNQDQLSTPPNVPYNKDEIPCTLYLIRWGSPRLVATTTNNHNVTWLVEVPQRPGHIAVPKFITITKTTLDTMGVSYFYLNQTQASMPNGTTLQFMADPNKLDISNFPDRLPAEILQVNMNGIPTNSLSHVELNMIICYELMDQTPNTNIVTQPTLSDLTQTSTSLPTQLLGVTQAVSQVQGQQTKSSISTDASTTTFSTLTSSTSFFTLTSTTITNTISTSLPATTFPYTTTTSATLSSTTTSSMMTESTTTSTTTITTITTTTLTTGGIQTTTTTTMNSGINSSATTTTNGDTPTATTTSSGINTMTTTATNGDTTTATTTSSSINTTTTIVLPVTTTNHTTVTSSTTNMTSMHHDTLRNMTSTGATTTSSIPLTSTTASPGQCSCTCQCPMGAATPQIPGATINYHHLLANEFTVKPHKFRMKRGLVNLAGPPVNNEE